MAGQLTDHPQFSLQTKQEILADWEAFILSGFDLVGASDVLISYLWWYAELGYQAEMPKAVDQIWWALFNDTTGMLWQVIVQFGTRAEPSTGRQTWLADGKVGDLNQAMCDYFAPYYEPFLEILTDFETEGELDLKAAAIDKAMQQWAAADPTLTAEERRPLALADDDAGVVSQNGGIYLTQDRHARLRAAAKIIPGMFRPLPRRPLRQPALFAMTRPPTEATRGPGLLIPADRQPAVAPKRLKATPAPLKTTAFPAVHSQAGRQ
jgi:hypothetical protein